MIWNLDMSWLPSYPICACLDDCLGKSLHFDGISHPPVQTQAYPFICSLIELLLQEFLS